MVLFYNIFHTNICFFDYDLKSDHNWAKVSTQVQGLVKEIGQIEEVANANGRKEVGGWG